MWGKAKRIIVDNVSLGSTDLSDIDELRLVERGESHPLLDIDDSEKLLALNLDQLNSSERQELLSEVVDSFESQHRLFGGDPNKVRENTESVLSNEEVQETVDWFRQYLEGPYLTLLERSLVINKGKFFHQLSREEGDKYKRDIADDFAEKASRGTYSAGYTSIHLASCGYYGEGGYVRNIFETLDEREEHIDHQRVFTTILKNNPFLITVGRDNVGDIIEEFEDKLRMADSYQFDIEFVDGRALGAANREVLEKSILAIQREAETLHYDCKVKPGETVYRLYPGSWRMTGS